MVSSRELIDMAVPVMDSVMDFDFPATGVLEGMAENLDARDLPEMNWLTDGATPGDGAGESQTASLSDGYLPHAPVDRLARSEPSGLTARETEALLLLAKGHTAAAAARRMGCSTSMVNRHLGKVYRKLGVNDRLGAVLEAQRRNLLPKHHPHSSASPAAPSGAPRPASIADAAS